MGGNAKEKIKLEIIPFDDQIKYLYSIETIFFSLNRMMDDDSMPLLDAQRK